MIDFNAAQQIQQAHQAHQQANPQQQSHQNSLFATASNSIFQSQAGTQTKMNCSGNNLPCFQQQFQNQQQLQNLQPQSQFQQHVPQYQLQNSQYTSQPQLQLQSQSNQVNVQQVGLTLAPPPQQQNQHQQQQNQQPIFGYQRGVYSRVKSFLNESNITARRDDSKTQILNTSIIFCDGYQNASILQLRLEDYYLIRTGQINTDLQIMATTAVQKNSFNQSLLRPLPNFKQPPTNPKPLPVHSSQPQKINTQVGNQENNRTVRNNLSSLGFQDNSNSNSLNNNVIGKSNHTPIFGQTSIGLSAANAKNSIFAGSQQQQQNQTNQYSNPQSAANQPLSDRTSAAFAQQLTFAGQPGAITQGQQQIGKQQVINAYQQQHLQQSQVSQNQGFSSNPQQPSAQNQLSMDSYYSETSQQQQPYSQKSFFGNQSMPQQVKLGDEFQNNQQQPYLQQQQQQLPQPQQQTDIFAGQQYYQQPIQQPLPPKQQTQTNKQQQNKNQNQQQQGLSQLLQQTNRLLGAIGGSAEEPKAYTLDEYCQFRRSEGLDERNRAKDIRQMYMMCPEQFAPVFSRRDIPPRRPIYVNMNESQGQKSFNLTHIYGLLRNSSQNTSTKERCSNKKILSERRESNNNIHNSSSSSNQLITCQRLAAESNESMLSNSALKERKERRTFNFYNQPLQNATAYERQLREKLVNFMQLNVKVTAYCHLSDGSLETIEIAGREVDTSSEVRVIGEICRQQLRATRKAKGMLFEDQQFEIILQSSGIRVEDISTNLSNLMQSPADDHIEVSVNFQRNTRPRMRGNNLVLVPSLEEFSAMSEEELRHIKNFSIEGHFGRIQWIDPVDVRDVDFDQVVKVNEAEIQVYSDNNDQTKPRVGEGLNGRCLITYKNVSSIQKLKEQGNLSSNAVLKCIEKQCEQQQVELISFDHDHLTWTIFVHNF